MIGLLFQNPLTFFIIALLLIIVISIHEFAHAFVADRLGDPTPKLAGRLTLHPLAHLDPIGTLLILFAGFGWGKPVPFDPFNLRNPNKDSALISLAGPLSNITMAIIGALVFRFMEWVPFILFGPVIVEIVSTFIYFNVLLAVFNLIPIHPLDGFKVVAGRLSKHYYHEWMELERYGMILLLLLILPIFGTAPVVNLVGPIVRFIIGILIPGTSGGII